MLINVFVISSLLCLTRAICFDFSPILRFNSSFLYKFTINDDNLYGSFDGTKKPVTPSSIIDEVPPTFVDIHVQPNT